MRANLVWLVAAFATATATAADAVSGSPPTAVADLETAYADAADAAGVLALLDAGLETRYDDRDRESWTAQRTAALARFDALDAGVPASGLPSAEARAVDVMRRKIAWYRPGEGTSLLPQGRCEDAGQHEADAPTLRSALYECFERHGNAIEFEGGRLTRVEALGRLAEIDEPERRKALFLAFNPLWRAVNGGNEPTSPYRRLMRLTASASVQGGTEIDVAARTLGLRGTDVESWLQRILEAWSDATAGPLVEPWDYRYLAGAADRELRSVVPRGALTAINERYYADLGVDLRSYGTLYDLDPRTGKAPLAFADFVTRGRAVDGQWQPTVTRVSGSYGGGGLGLLNELVHENGHVVHMMALRTRPAFMDLGDAVFYEAFADVPSWNTYDPDWQLKYLGKAVPRETGLRALFSGVMLDVAWALFEARMLRSPESDPNATWSAIATRYLHVRAHPELSWWAVRVQLVDSPGYMANYGLGAILTADLRRHVASQLGPFATGDPRWYGWLAERLLHRGEELETSELLREFLGRPVSPDALLGEIARIRP